MICSICSNEIGTDENGWSGGHNAKPVTNGRCCEPCNREIVFPAELKQAGYSQLEILEAISKKEA